MVEKQVSEKKSLEAQNVAYMSKCRVMKNLITVCLGFFFLFCAFQSLASLQTTINRQGSMSQSVIYAAFVASSLLLPKLMISKLGCKNTLVLSILTYIPFMASNYHRDFLTQFFTSILLGLGGAILWSSGCTYINEISVLYASHNKESVDVVTPRFFGIFFMIFQNSQIWGNLASFYVLKPVYRTGFDIEFVPADANDSILPAPINNMTVACGVEFCGGISQNVSELSEDKRYILITVYLGFTILAAAVVAILLDPIERSDSEEGSNLLFSKLIATVKHLRKSDQVFLIPVTIFMGLEQAFILSDYSQGYVACAWDIHNVSLVFICFGVVSALASFLTGRISKYVPRLVILLTGASGNVLACTIMFLWSPDKKDVVYFFIVVGLWGTSDAIWQTEINSMYGILFRKDEEAAYGNLRLWEAIGFFIPYFCNKRLCMSSKLYLVMAVLATGLIGCMIVEIKAVVKNKTFCIAKEKTVIKVDNKF